MNTEESGRTVFTCSPDLGFSLKLPARTITACWLRHWQIEKIMRRLCHQCIWFILKPITSSEAVVGCLHAPICWKATRALLMALLLVTSICLRNVCSRSAVTEVCIYIGIHIRFMKGNFTKQLHSFCGQYFSISVLFNSSLKNENSVIFFICITLYGIVL